MTEVSFGTSAASWAQPATLRRLEARIRLALRQSREQAAPVLLSVTERSEQTEDPTAVVAASRRRGEPWFCLEQPDRGGWALAALGSVRALEDHGQGRFKRAGAVWSGLAARALADPPE